MTDHETLRTALAEFHAGRSWARRDLSALPLNAVQNVGPQQIVLTSTFEERGIQYALSPNPTGPTLVSPPDPWAFDLRPPPFGAHPERATVPAPGEVSLNCSMCQETGEGSCRNCSGHGNVSSGNSNQTCPLCQGRGRTRCPDCAGSGKLYGRPSVWSQMGRQEDVRVVEVAELPVEVFLGLQDSSIQATTVATQQEAQISEPAFRRGGGSYRDAALADDRTVATAQQMLDTLTLPPLAQLRQQTLELRQLPAWSFEHEQGRKLTLYGSPPRIYPAYALATFLGTTIGRLIGG